MLYSPSHPVGLPGRLVLATNVTLFLLAAAYLIYLAGQLTSNDFQVYYWAAAALREQRSPYEVPLYVYSPLFAWLAQPLAWLSLPEARLFWFGLQVVALGGTVALSISLSGSMLARRYWALVFLMVAIATPTYLDLILGQIGSLIAFGIVAAYGCLRRYPRLGGALFALVTMIKLYPALLWVGFVVRKQWSSAGWVAVMGLLLLAAALVLCGVDQHSAFVASLSGPVAYPYTAEHNNSIVAFWLRLLTTNPFVASLADLPMIAYLSIVCSIGLVLVACVWVAPGQPDDLGQLLQHNVWICAMLLLSPANGIYNLMLLVLPCLTTLRYYELTKERAVLRWLLVATVWNYLPTVSAFYSQQELQLLPGAALFLALPFYGLIIYFILVVWLAQRAIVATQSVIR